MRQEIAATVETSLQGAEERQAFAEHSPWWGEHVARYQLAQPFVEGRRVLDLACGSGVGLAILQRHARELVGIDADAEVVREVQSRVASDRTQVLLGDACALELPNASFDTVVSFETIEHLNDRARFLAELRRVLRPDGTLLLSTPNALYTEPVAGKPRNPYHVHEYTPDELREELEAHFGKVRLLGQRLDSRFVIEPFADGQRKMARTPWNRMGIGLRRALYRMPPAWRDWASELLWRHPFFPGPRDFHFDEAHIERAPVLLAIAAGERARA